MLGLKLNHASKMGYSKQCMWPFWRRQVITAIECRDYSGAWQTQCTVRSQGMSCQQTRARLLPMNHGE